MTIKLLISEIYHLNSIANGGEIVEASIQSVFAMEELFSPLEGQSNYGT